MRLGGRSLQRLYIGGDVDLLDVGELANLGCSTQTKKWHAARKGHAGVLVADRRGEEFDERRAACSGIGGPARRASYAAPMPWPAQGNAGQDRSQRRAWHRPADAARLFRPVHCKPLPAQEVRALLTARKLRQTKNHDVENSLRGVLRGFGLKVGPTTPRTFVGRIRELVAGHGRLSTVAEALLAARFSSNG